MGDLPFTQIVIEPPRPHHAHFAEFARSNDIAAGEKQVVTAALHADLHDLRVPVLGSRNEHRLDVLVGQKLLVVAVRRGSRGLRFLRG